MVKKGKQKFEEVEAIEDDVEDNENDEDDEITDEEYVQYRRKRLRWIVIGVFVVIIILILGFYFAVINPPGVLDIYPGDALDNEEKDGITVTADIALKGTGKAEGDADLKIQYKGDTTYSSKVSVKNGRLEKKIKYNEFVEGNGDYVITITFEGKSKKFGDPYEVNWVVEDLSLNLERMSYNEVENLSASSSPFFYVSVDFNDNKGIRMPETRPLDVNIELFYENEQSSFEDDDIKIENKYETNIRKSYTYKDGGNMTVKATITNDNVKSTSKFHTLSGENNGFINTPPEAKGELTNGNNGKISLIGDNGIAEFDASDSFDTDGEIVKYQWEFDDEGSDDNIITTNEPIASHQYTAVDDYDVILTVIDNFGRDMDDIQGFDSQIISIEVKNLPI